MQKFTLESALSYIQFQTGKEVTGIHYVDGSSRNFIVMFAGAFEWEFFKL
jgi:hypothetical protein